MLQLLNTAAAALSRRPTNPSARVPGKADCIETILYTSTYVAPLASHSKLGLRTGRPSAPELPLRPVRTELRGDLPARLHKIAPLHQPETHTTAPRAPLRQQQSPAQACWPPVASRLELWDTLSSVPAGLEGGWVPCVVLCVSAVVCKFLASARRSVFYSKSKLGSPGARKKGESAGLAAAGRCVHDSWLY